MMDQNRKGTQRSLQKTFILLLALGGILCAPAALGAPIVSQTQHIRLGFDASFPFSDSRGDSFDGCPFVPPGLPAGVSYSLGISGMGNIHFDAGVDMTFHYDKADVVAGGVLPLNVTYSPVAGGGPNISINIPTTITVEGCIIECFLPDICGSVLIPCHFEAGPKNFVAPLTGNTPIEVPVESCAVSLNIAGVIDVGTATVEGSITLSPMPVGGLGIGGAISAFGVQSGPATAPLIPLLQWDTAGQTVSANLTLTDPLPGAANVEVAFGPIVHWVATSADLRLKIVLGSVFHDLGISDPSDIVLFSGNLGPVFSAVGLDTQVSAAVTDAVGFDPGFGAAIAAGNLPVPLTSPEIQEIDSSTTPVFGAIQFTLNTDVTPPISSAIKQPASTPFGWNNTDVSVSISAMDPGGSGVKSITYSAAGAHPIADTTVNAAAVAFGITSPGITTVTFFAIDNAGNVEGPNTITVRIDKLPPTLVIVQPAPTTYTHSETLVLDYSVSDTGGSGVDTFEALIDGSGLLAGHGLPSGQSIDLLTELALGTHTFTVNAVDKAGNNASSSVTFEIIVTPESVKQDVDHFLAAGKVKHAGLANSLLAKLNAAASAYANGNCNTAANIYSAFIAEVQAQTGTGIDATAAAILIADAQYLINHCPL